MGSVVFTWQEPLCELLLVQLKEGRVIGPAGWWVEDEETKDILAARDEKTGGTLLGCSKQGRVACLVSTTYLTPPQAELLPVRFLKGKMSPREFAEELQSNKNLSLDLTFYLVVADIPSKSMFYISKKSEDKEIDEIREVDPGCHGIFETGLVNDATCPKNKRLEDKFREVITQSENGELSMKDIADKLMKDGELTEPLGAGECNTSKITVQERSNGSTGVDVRTTKKVRFCEVFVVDDEYVEREFNFDIEYS